MTMRSVAYVGTVALLAQVFLTQGCGSNAPSTTGSNGGTTSAGGVISTGGVTSAGGVTSTGGVTSAGGSTVVASTGGTTTPYTAGTGGSTTPASTGTGGSAGTTGTGAFDPLCGGLLTAAGPAPTKNGICTADDPQLCYKTCGPASVGFKSETCTAGMYVEQSGCSFPPDQDYSCYKVNNDSSGALILDASCPAAVPQANTVCSVNTCILCNVSGGYLDSSGAAKVGYCVCPAPSAATGVSKWTCAASTAWPCPAGKGC